MSCFANYVESAKSYLADFEDLEMRVGKDESVSVSGPKSLEGVMWRG
jgi:hypothetical protein